MRCSECQKEWEEDPLSDIFMNERETKFFHKGVKEGRGGIVQDVINALIEFRDMDKMKKKQLKNLEDDLK